MIVRVVGIDPSLSATGIVDSDGAMKTVGGDSRVGDQRLAKIYDAVYVAVAPAHLVVIEDLPTHAKGAGFTGRAQGVVRLALINAGVDYVAVIPSALKKFATGNGNANKADMRMEIFKRAGVDIRDEDQVDAWWLRAAGLQYLGQPVVTLPADQRAVLDKVAWPELT